jgi:DNA-binding beta-propeller fold protein YncE
MRMEFSRSSKMMGVFVLASLAFFLCSGFDLGCNPCDEERTKADKYPLQWVACVDNKPTLMRYFENFPIPFPSPDFNPKDYDCSHPNSPAYKGSGRSLATSTPSGPVPSAGLGAKENRAANTPEATSGFVAYLPPLLRDLPFLPSVSPPAPACDPSFPDVLQTIHTNAQVTRISTCPFQIKATIPVVSRPLQIAITPDGSTALVTSFDGAINFIDLATNKVTFTLFVDDAVSPNGIDISPDGTRAYITSFDPDFPVVQVIDLTSRKVIATFMTTLQYPQGATLTPDGSQLWITGPLDSIMDIYDTASNTLITRLNLGNTTDVAFNSTGTRAYVTSQSNSPGVVAVVDTATFQILKSYQVGAGPTDIAMSYGDQVLVVNNSLSGTVSVIDLDLGKVVTSAKLGNTVSGISIVH